MRYPRYWTVIFLLALAAGALYRRGDKDHVPSSTPLTDFPASIGNMSSVDTPIDPEALAILGQGFFLNRVFSPPKLDSSDRGAEIGAAPTVGEAAAVGLFIAYFPTQRTGQSIHSPQNCLPGSGWTFESSGTTELTDASGKLSQFGDYIIVNGDQRAEVLYWYQSHGRAIASDYKAKLFMLVDSIRYSRSDAALVRIVTPILRGEARDAAHQRAVRFAQHLIPMLPAYIPN
jgi:EpsI family protein